MYGQMCRSSSVPFRRPAVLNGWHGYPPVRMSIGSTAAQSTTVRSPKLGVSGQWW